MADQQDELPEEHSIKATLPPPDTDDSSSAIHSTAESTNGEEEDDDDEQEEDGASSQPVGNTTEGLAITEFHAPEDDVSPVEADQDNSGGPTDPAVSMEDITTTIYDPQDPSQTPKATALPPIQVQPEPERAVESPVQTNGGDSAPSGPPTSTASASASRSRTDSVSTTATTTTQSSTRSSLVFVTAALETISSSKDAQRSKEMKDAAQSALNEIKQKGDPQQIDPKTLFEPLRLATEASTEVVVTTALDCIGKLISYSYFSLPSEQQGPDSESLIDQAIDTICDCFEGEATPDRVQLQIMISLLAAVLNDKVVVHGAGLLKAVRQMYNIFLYSKNPRNQQVAQGTLSQMVGTVFERARARIIAKEARVNLSKVSLDDDDEAVSRDDLETQHSETPDRSTEAVDDITSQQDRDASTEELQDKPVEKEGGTKMTLQTFERRGSFDEDHLKEGPTMVTKVKPRRTANQEDGDVRATDRTELTEEDEEDEVFMKDAFLVFRAMCKISIKPLRADEVGDSRSQGMRTKLLSLHIIHTVLFHNMPLFVSPLATIRSSSSNEATPFIQAIKQLLCQSLSRNGASSINRVFEIGCEIFWLMLKHLRVMLKKEIEVFLKEIYLTILENRNAPTFQKHGFLNILERLAQDGRALVEVYLNYDCDRTASDNMFQRIIEHLSRLSTIPVTITSIQQHAYQSNAAKKTALADWQIKGNVPSSLATPAAASSFENDYGYPLEYAMKQQSLECMVETLRSLVHWSQQGVVATPAIPADSETKLSTDEQRESNDLRNSAGLAAPYIASTETPPDGTPLAEDDPAELERVKARKTAMTNAVRQFNFKPKRGIKILLENGFISDHSPETIAKFFLDNDLFDKAALGEFLGEGDPENVAIMHAFVDAMEFRKTRFVDALRRFLQSFRLPGEAQKIDRFMLKFAERYIQGNPNAFANADTAYVLAYSVIMLNTDQHSSKLKGKRMTPEDFIKNNRGINDNADLPEDYLRGIFDEIAHNEIVLDTEREIAANLGHAAPQPSGGFASNLGQAFSNAGRDLQREAYMQKSEEMANKTEQLFKSLVRAQRRNAEPASSAKFIPAVSFRHAGPMFEVTWTPFLTALSGCTQDTNNLETVKLCMDGLKLAIQISCLFDLENPRAAFVASIARFTNLYNLSEMRAKNVEALRVLLDVAHTEGNSLKESWRDILTCISQLDRFQLISEGVPERAVPDMLRAKPTPTRTSSSRGSLQVPNRSRVRSSGSKYSQDIAEESRSTGIIMGVDRIFTNSSKLSGEAIVHFVRALTQVSWQEIESSGQSQDPRTFSLQKLVEVSEYNMGRVRFEWTTIWDVLGDHFHQVGCHTNTKVVHFALNSLRQLSIRFLDLEELPGFKFQKDFLKPFEYVIHNSGVVQVKEIVLHSLIQMIQARGENIHSGWRTIFGAFTVAAREQFEGLVTLAYDNVIEIYNTRFGVIITQGAFADLVVCLTEFAKNSKFQKKSLQAIDTLKATIFKMLKTPECPLSSNPNPAPMQPSRQTQEEQFWFPVLFAFHDVLMTGDDLEVRSRALNYLFDTLVKHGKDFPQDFWDIIWRQLLYPIFMVLKSKSELNRVVNHEELSVWLSTTMIQALRNLMSLFTHYFESLEYMLDRFLDLLTLCICQENDTLARIGSNCLQTLILQNVNKFTAEHWSKVVTCFVELFARTEATALFSAAASYSSSTPVNGIGISTPALPQDEAPSMEDLHLSRRTSGKSIPTVAPSLSRAESTGEVTNGDDQADIPPPPPPHSLDAQTPILEDYRPESQLQQASVVVTAARRRFFNQIITKCVLQLLMIETVNELFSNDTVYAQIPSNELLRLMSLLKKSYHFAKRFNDDLDLRNRLFQEGFMKQPPNLLKQESGSASVYVNILFRMYHDGSSERVRNRAQTEEALIPLCVDIVDSFVRLSEETQQRNIATWRPVVVDVIDGCANFSRDEFVKHAPDFAPLVVGLLGREMGMELQRAVQSLLQRILECHYDMPMLEFVPTTPTPVSPRASVYSSRRASRASK